MSRKPYLGPSDSQANADALYRRDHTWTAPHEASVRVAWDWHRREPENLREAERMVLRAYADEIPGKLHEGDELAQDGTPKMTAKAEGYIFGHDEADDASRDAETGQRDLVGYHYTPFRAALHAMQHDRNEAIRKRGTIVSHVAIGSQGAVAAAVTEGVPAWCAYVVAEHALREFLRRMTDLRLHVPKEESAA